METAGGDAGLVHVAAERRLVAWLHDDESFALSVFDEALVDPGDVVVLEPQVLLVELQVRDQLLLLLVRYQEVRYQTVERLVVLCIAAEGLLVVLDSKGFVFLNLEGFGQDEVLETLIVLLLLVLPEAVRDVAHRVVLVRGE